MSTPAAHLKPLAHTPSASSVKNVPVNLFGSVMGLAGLALAWRLAAKTYDFSPAVGEGIGLFAALVFIVLGLGYFAKWVKYPEAVSAEFNHPVMSNFFGTIAIAVLLLSAVLSHYSQPLGQNLWIVGTVSTIVLAFIVVTKLLKGGLDNAMAVPAWLIPGVATLDIVVTGAHMPFSWAHEVNLFSLGVGAIVAAVFFTLIMARLIHSEPLAPAMVPSMMILIAPFEVGFLAYTNFTGQIDAFASMLYFFGLFMFVILAVKIFRPSTPFTPGYWAISFPMAALSNAALKYAAMAGGWLPPAIAWIILVFLTVALLLLTVRTLHILFNGKLLRG